MNLIEEIKADISAAAALADWLGDTGDPVNRIVAEFRAHKCIAGDGGKPCPKNVEPNWWDRVKHKIADWIRAELAVKKQMELRVEYEDSLHMCKACGCCLRLKVWVPTVHIRKHADLSKIQKTPAYCWQRKELL